MNKLLSKKIFCFLFLYFSGSLLWAQTPQPVSSLDDAMRSHDKIYVVMAVCLIILIVLFLYLIRIDIKVSKKEKTV